MGSLGVTAALVLVAACGIDTMPETAAPAPIYRDVVELFDRGVARTCALNNGVCHNSNNYPDLHTVANVLATVDRPCNVELADRTRVHDACEPAADHFVLASIDSRIARASFLPADAGAPALTQVTLVLDPPPADLAPGATGAVVRRGATSFAIDARIATVAGASVTLDLRAASAPTRRFFDLRVYPPGALQLRVGDPNGNGIEGARGASMPLITVGDPDASYLLRRLVDDTYGELMPRQCRTWDDRANHALACWIAGLQRDDTGRIANAYDPIDYSACALAFDGLGKCGPIAEP